NETEAHKSSRGVPAIHRRGTLPSVYGSLLWRKGSAGGDGMTPRNLHRWAPAWTLALRRPRNLFAVAGFYGIELLSSLKVKRSWSGSRSARLSADSSRPWRSPLAAVALKTGLNPPWRIGVPISSRT